MLFIEIQFLIKPVIKTHTKKVYERYIILVESLPGRDRQKGPSLHGLTCLEGCRQKVDSGSRMKHKKLNYQEPHKAQRVYALKVTKIIIFYNSTKT